MRARDRRCRGQEARGDSRDPLRDHDRERHRLHRGGRPEGRVKIASIDDFTTDKVEIELTLPRGVTAKEVIPQLYAYTDCSVSVSSNVVVIDDRKPVQL